MDKSGGWRGTISLGRSHSFTESSASLRNGGSDAQLSLDAYDRICNRTARRMYPGPMPSSMKMLKAFANISIIALLVCQGCVLTLAEESSTKILENERVVVWRIGADTNSLAPARQPRFPAVLISLVDGAVRFIDATGTSTIRPESGQAVLIELKDHLVTPLEEPGTIARAFPRQGAKQIIDNNRVNVWDVRPDPKGIRTPKHFSR